MRTIREIAVEIREDWKTVNFGAKPYLAAMHQLQDMNSRYEFDDARSIVSYFLANASTWRGDTAKRVKKELNSMLKRK
jgi:hypothetical protein